MILKCAVLLVLMVQGAALCIMQLYMFCDIPINNLHVYVVACIIVILILGGWFKNEDNRIE